MDKLEALASKRSLGPVLPVSLPPPLAAVVTPLIAEAWAIELAAHPDPRFRNFLVKGLQEGFRIGYDTNQIQLRSSRSNMASAREHPEVVQTYLQEELTQGRIGVVTPYPHIAKICHISPFGVIPKKSKPGKWRLILDLSSPSAHSVNDGIAKESAGLSHVSIDDVTTCILQVGRGALLAKIDIKHAYRNVPVHPEDRCLLGMAWKN